MRVRTKLKPYAAILYCLAASCAVHAALLLLPGWNIQTQPEDQSYFAAELIESPPGSATAKLAATGTSTAASVKESKKTADVQPATSRQTQTPDEQQPAFDTTAPAAPDTQQDPGENSGKAPDSDTQTPPETRPAADQSSAAGKTQNDNGNGQSSKPSQTDIDRAVARYKASLQSSIDKKKLYPRRARDQGQSGTVVVRFSLNRHGVLLGQPSVVEPGSRYPSLNNAAVQAILDAAPTFSAFPPEDPRDEIEFTIPISFELR